METPALTLTLPAVTTLLQFTKPGLAVTAKA